MRPSQAFNVSRKPSTSRDAFKLVQEPQTGTEAWHRWLLYWSAKNHVRAQSTLKSLTEGYSLGHVHSELRLFSAVTVRTSMRQVSLQNIFGPLRGLLRAAPGHVLISIDIEQAEVRVAAALSQDSALLEAFESSDVYVEMAKQLFALSDITPEQRTAAKTLTLGVLYGMGAATLAGRLGNSPAEAARLLKSFWATYPQLNQYRMKVQEAAGTQQCSMTLGRPLSLLSTDDKHKALNACVQAECADIITVRAVEVAARLGTESLWLAVHDQLVVEVTPDRADEALRVLSEVATVPFLGVPMWGTPEVIGRAWRK